MEEGRVIIDLDSHLRESYFLDDVFKLEGKFADLTPVCVSEGTAPHERRFSNKLRQQNQSADSPSGYNHGYMYDPKVAWRGGEIAARQPGGYDMQIRSDALETERIDHQLIFPTGISLPTTTEGELGAALCQAYNNWVAGLVKGYEDRFWPVAMIQAGCPEEMPAELRRCVNELGFKTAHLVSYCGDRNLDDPSFFPYYEEAERLGVPLFCHPNGHIGPITERFGNFLAMHVLGRPTNCTQALVGLVCGGVFEKFPNLKVAFFECSSEWPLYWMHRMDDDFEWLKDDQHRHMPIHLSMPPSEYVKRNCYITCEADEEYLGAALEEVPETHVLMATDYPHFDSEYPETTSKI